MKFYSNDIIKWSFNNSHYAIVKLIDIDENNIHTVEMLYNNYGAENKTYYWQNIGYDEKLELVSPKDKLEAL